MNHTESTFEQAKQLIYSVDLAPVINRLVAIEGWPQSDAAAAVNQYRNYLLLRKKYPDLDLPPSKDIDDAWHAHILHTKDYRAFCKQAFNDRDDFYLDHDPHLVKEGSMERLAQLFEQTQKLYHQEFGEYIYQIRPQSFLAKILGKILP
jgi:hypothetical protein